MAVCWWFLVVSTALRRGIVRPENLLLWGAILQGDEGIRRYASDLSGVYKVAFGTAAAEVAPVVGGEELVMAAHNVTLITVRRFREAQLETTCRLQDDRERVVGLGVVRLRRVTSWPAFFLRSLLMSCRMKSNY